MGTARRRALWMPGSVREVLHDATAAIRYNADLLRKTLDHVGLGIAVFDAEGKLEIWNERFAALVGVPRELLGTGVSGDAAVRPRADPGRAHRLERAADARAAPRRRQLDRIAHRSPDRRRHRGDRQRRDRARARRRSPARQRAAHPHRHRQRPGADRLCRPRPALPLHQPRLPGDHAHRRGRDRGPPRARDPGRGALSPPAALCRGGAGRHAADTSRSSSRPTTRRSRWRAAPTCRISTRRARWSASSCSMSTSRSGGAPRPRCASPTNRWSGAWSSAPPNWKRRAPRRKRPTSTRPASSPPPATICCSPCMPRACSSPRWRSGIRATSWWRRSITAWARSNPCSMRCSTSPSSTPAR